MYLKLLGILQSLLTLLTKAKNGTKEHLPLLEELIYLCALFLSCCLYLPEVLKVWGLM